MDRSVLTRLLPTAVKRRLRPLLAPLAYAAERPRMRAFYGGIVGAGDLVFDVGAAEGYHAAVLAAVGARVVCLEPQPYCLDVLRRRFAGHPGVRVVAAGVGAAAGEATLHVSRGDPEISTFGIDKWRAGRFAGFAWEDRVTVPVVTLDGLIADHGEPALVKIDVEGWEPMVLAGLGRQLPWLTFEFTREYLDDARSCVERLAALGPTEFNATLFRRWRFLLEGWVDGDELLEVLARHAGRTVFGDIHARPASGHQARPERSDSNSSS